MCYRESGTDHEVSLKYTYNKKNLITRLDENVNGNTRSTVYTYDGSNRVATIRKGSSRVTYTYDNFSRVTGMVTTHVKTDSSADILREHFTYHNPKAGHTSSLVATYRTEGDGNYDVTYSYTYDNNGNILTVSDGTNTTSYVYDSANQLIRENNQAGGFTHVWTYDDAGNITSRTEYAYTTGSLGTPTDTVTYTYGNNNWGDLLTAYDGQTISHDNIGNPLSDGTWTYTWKHGRQLATMSDGTTTWSYTYNADGLRTKRTNGTCT